MGMIVGVQNQHTQGTGQKLVEGIQAFKAYTNFPGDDLITAASREQGFQVDPLK